MAVVNIEEIKAYKTEDGAIHESIDEAIKHQVMLDVEKLMQYDSYYDKFYGALMLENAEQLRQFLYTYEESILALMKWEKQND